MQSLCMFSTEILTAPLSDKCDKRDFVIYTKGRLHMPVKSYLQSYRKVSVEIVLEINTRIAPVKFSTFYGFARFVTIR
jgi:hypothetical protein